MTPCAPPSASAVATPVSRWADAAARAQTRRTRRRLLVAAAVQFDANGFSGASVNGILAEADLTKGALYFHFPSKHALARAVLAEVRDSWSLLVEEIGARGLDPLWRLLVETDAYVGRWMHDPLVRGISRALDDPELRPERRDWFECWEKATTLRLEEAARAGVLRPACVARETARTVLTTQAGHYMLCDGPRDLWQRTNESWVALLPRVATPAWLEAWRASSWTSRPEPDPDRYRRVRVP